MYNLTDAITGLAAELTVEPVDLWWIKEYLNDAAEMIMEGEEFDMSQAEQEFKDSVSRATYERMLEADE